MGGLGNQIFQIFTTISYSIKSRNQFKFVNLKTLGCGNTTIRYTFWDSFFFKLKPFLINELPKNLYVINEKDFTYNDIPIDNIKNKDVLLFGYFQSYKYFDTNYDIICRIICLDKMREVLLKKLNLNINFFENTISIHFRMGDYKNIQHVHPIMTKDYYELCLNYIKSKYVTINFKVIYFCENTDIDDVNEIIVYLKSTFFNYEFIRGDKTLTDWEQMLLMSLCHHNIIANSSFSWWSAYFNKWRDKIVCYPSKWFGNSTNHDTKDLCPIEWIKIPS